MKRWMIASVVVTAMGFGQAGAAEHLVRNDEEVKAAIAAAQPGDTIVLAEGRYVGKWELRPGEPGKPITIKASRPGRVFVGSATLLVGLEAVPVSRYSYSMPWKALPLKPGEPDPNKSPLPGSPYVVGASPRKLRELDTGKELRWMETPTDVEEVVGSYCYDVESQRLYVHPTDSAGVAHHSYAPVETANGIVVANHTVVDGLVMTGFGGAAIQAAGVTAATITDCKLFRNGSAISLGAAKNCVVRNNECWENCPDYSQAAQIFCSDGTEGTVIEGNYVHGGDGNHTGIFIYGDSTNNTYRNNVVWGALGMAAKGHGPMQNLSEFNVSDGYVATQIMHWNTSASSDAALGNPDPQTDLITSVQKEQPKFADPAWADYRLQSDSPMRGRAKDGKDLGAFQYRGEVVFVRPDGDDGAEGTSVASAWKTLARAGRNLKAGQTLYIFPGTYSEPLVLRDKAAPDGQKTLVRVHGKGAATVRGLEIKGCTSLEVANLTVSGAEGAGIDIQESRGVTLTHCVSYGSKSEGVSIAGSDRVSVRRCALWGNAVGLRASQSRDVELVSSLVGKNTRTQVLLAEGTRDYHGNFNAFIGANLGEIAEGSGKAADIGAWRALCGSEAASLVSTVAPVAPEKGDFRVPAGTILATSGLYDSPVGPHGVFAGQKLARKRIEGVEVVSVTSTSANILWYTPGRMTGTALQWGLTPEYGNLHDRTSDYMSEFELVHTVSLINLKPGTTYHFRPGGLDVLKEEPAITWDDQGYTFTTANEDPAPRQLHVATTGDDSHDGLTPQTPWKTLHKAAREARAGDTVTIAPGRYVELLRPLQTGTAEDRRITFRAEKPLSVFLEGGMVKFTRPGRPHVVQLHSKAFITIENLTGMYVSEGTDYGGYRDGWGYAGIFRVSGGGMNEFKGCVADARYRWASGFVFFEGGVMPGMTMPPYAAKVSDSATLACWRAVQGRVKRAPLILDHNVYYVSLTGMYSPYGGGEKWVSRNCIYQDLCDQKRAGPYTTFWSSTVYDSDYSCFAWMPEGTRFVANGTKELGRVDEEGHVPIVGLKAWQEFSKRDLHSIEHTPEYGLTPLEIGKGKGFDLRTLTIEDFVLPKDSPLRGRGEGGSDIGVRWEHYLDPDKSASKPVTTAPPAAADAAADQKVPNLLLNASFEDVDPRHNIPDGWNIAGGVLNGNTMEMDNGVARTGKRSLRMKFNPGGPSEIVLTRDCVPPIDEGKTYTYSAWVKTKDLAGKAYLFMYQYPPPFTEGNQAFSEATVTGTSDWTRLSIVFKVREGLTFAQLRCGVSGTSGEAWFDDVAITEGPLAPEPAASAGK